MATQFLILALDDQIFTPLVDYIYQSNRNHQGPRTGGRRFQLGAPNNVVRKLLWVAGDDGRLPANDLFNAMRAAGQGEIIVSPTHQNVLSGLQDGDQIYICVHGQYQGATDTATNRICVDNSVARGAFDAAWLATQLTTTYGMPNALVHLKVFACYSSKGRGDLDALARRDAMSLKALVRQSFAGILKGSLAGTHGNVTVSGYVGATRLPAAAGRNLKMAYGRGHDDHTFSARDYRVTFPANSNDVTLPDGWEQWA
jgi:hypothetical protein